MKKFEQDYKKLVAKIQEAVPEIMELKFGCKIISRIWGKSIIKDYSPGSDAGNGQKESWLCSPVPDKNGQTNGTSFVDRENIKKILGRDITLEDVLVAIEEEFAKMPSVIIEEKIALLLRKWTLNKSLEWHYKNKPETVEFLINLIVEK